jgi:hypothetical protein
MRATYLTTTVFPRGFNHYHPIWSLWLTVYPGKVGDHQHCLRKRQFGQQPGIQKCTKMPAPPWLQIELDLAV